MRGQPREQVPTSLESSVIAGWPHLRSYGASKGGGLRGSALQGQTLLPFSVCVGSAYGHSLNPEFSVCQSGVSRPPQEEVGKGPHGKGCRQLTKAPGNGPFFPTWKQGLKVL